MIVRFALWALLLGLSVPASAQLYKWVDAEGRVHYTDQPPPASAKQDQKLDIKKKSQPATPATAATGGDQAAPQAPQTYQEKELEYKKRKVEQEQAQAKAMEQAKKEQDLCSSARQRLATYQDVGRVYTLDDKGERIYADDAIRQQHLDEAQQDIAKYCK